MRHSSIGIAVLQGGEGVKDYVSEAQGHIQELYELLLITDEDARSHSTYSRRTPTLEEMQRNAEEFMATVFVPADPGILVARNSRRAKRILTAITVLELFEAKALKAQFQEWLPYAVEFLHKSPSARYRHRLKDEVDRTLFICSCLWHARQALAWLKERDFEGLLRGGIGYRAQTAQAARMASIHPPHDGNRPLSLFPLDRDASEGLTTSEERRRYKKWTYDPSDDPSS